MSELSRIFVIAGPTASGKSDIAVSLARTLSTKQTKNRYGISGAEIISADSRQVFKGMNLGTGKITTKEMMGIPHHLLDVVNPWNRYSVAQFKKQGRKIVKDILKRNNVVIVCGGTGHYIEALVEGLVIPEVPPNKELRNELSKKTTEELFALLKKLDPVFAGVVDSKNPRRLFRAIEIAKKLGRVPKKQYDPLPYKTTWIGVTKDQEELKKRIHARLLKRIKLGMIEEIENLHNGKLGKKVSWKTLDDFGLEYRYVSRFLRGLISKNEMIDQLEREINAYAKRQITWFKRNKQIHWIQTKADIKEFLKK